jgi:hypothetical protein
VWWLHYFLAFSLVLPSTFSVISKYILLSAEFSTVNKTVSVRHFSFRRLSFLSCIWIEPNKTVPKYLGRLFAFKWIKSHIRSRKIGKIIDSAMTGLFTIKPALDVLKKTECFNNRFLFFFCPVEFNSRYRKIYPYGFVFCTLILTYITLKARSSLTSGLLKKWRTAIAFRAFINKWYESSLMHSIHVLFMFFITTWNGMGYFGYVTPSWLS